MKQKEVIQLLIAVAVVAAAGYLVYSLLFPAKPGGNKGLTYTKVMPVNPNFDQDALGRLSDSVKSRDFYNAPDLKNGLGNNQPFGPLR